MLKFISYFISLFLIVSILFQLPESSGDLASLRPQISLLGSPNSSRRLLNIITLFCILTYLSLAIQFNINAVGIN